MPTYEQLGIDIKPHGPKNQKVHCPVCHNERRNKADKSLSVDTVECVYNCHHCGWAGKYFTTEQQAMKDEKKRKEWAKPNSIELPLSEPTIDWFASRGITRETLQYFKVSQSREWMPERTGHAAGERNCINFNYYRDGQKVNVKFRDPLKCFRMTKDAELILYNQDALRDRTDMLICEGEIDCMSFYQAGHFGAVSVPNGASKGNVRLEYLDNCADVFAKMEKIVIAVDGDEAGEALRRELTRRLGIHRCWFVTYPDGCKDANEVLLKHGVTGVKELYKNAIAPPIDDILTVDDMRDDIEHIYENGWPDIEPIGYLQFDRLLNFAPGEVTTVTGIPQHGKDEFIRQVLIRKAARYGEKSFVFNYEEPAKIQAIKACQQFIGKPFFRKDRTQMMNEAQKDAALKFVNHHLIFVDILSADLTIDGLLKKAAEVVLRKGVKYVVIGPYNCVEGKRPPQMTEGEYVSEIYQKLTRFALKYEAHVFFVAHTTKMAKDKKTKTYEVPNLYNISGSANFFNKTHNGLTIFRNYATNTTDVHVQKCKFFFNGQLGMQTFDFDVPTARYAEDGTPFESMLDYLKKGQVQTDIPLDTSPRNNGPTQWQYPDPDLSNWTEPLPVDAVPF